MEGLNVLSLFDGMSCGRIALERAGIPVKNYYASEVDKYAVQISKKNYPDIIQVGDVTKLNCLKYTFTGSNTVTINHTIDLLIGGSPCQGFSVAGKHLNFEDPKSKLFFEFVRILNEIRVYNPDVGVLLENVKMKKEYQNVISNQLGVNPIEINSSTFSGQMRSRLYWTNIATSGLPVNNNVLFQDILESDLAVKEKAYALTATYYKKGSEATRQRAFKKAQRPIAWIDDNTTRWLTPLECERLQTLPDNYTEGVSNTQRYKMIGNGWTVDVIAFLFKNLKK